MKDRGKALATYSGSDFSDCYYDPTSVLPCRKHPSSSPVGICAYCLKDRLIKLVCSDCGEQRLSSCSCSGEISSNTNSGNVEIGSVGRISFLIENERAEIPQSTSKHMREEFVLLKRSTSRKRENRFWRIGKLFRKKKERSCDTSLNGFDNKSDIWVFDHMPVRRSRSLNSFREGLFGGSHDGGRLNVSAARSSSVTCGFTESEPRRSSLSEPRKSNLSEPRKSNLSEPRKSGLDVEKREEFVKKSGFLDLENGIPSARKRGFTLKESDFSALDGSNFFDLKLDLSSESKPEFPSVKMVDSDSGFPPFLRGGSLLGHHECGASFRSSEGNGLFSRGGSCRITVNDRGVKRCRKSMKVLRWIFRQNSSCRSARKKDEDAQF